MTQQFTTAQLEAWAGLGPWSYRPHKYDDWGIVRSGNYFVCQAKDHRSMDDNYLNLCREEKRDPHEIFARLIAAAPDLARLVLEKDTEIAELKEEISIWQSVFPDIAPDSVMPDRSKVEAENARLSALISRLRASLFSYANAFSFSASPSEVSKCLTSLVTYIDTNTDARQAMKETSDE